MIHFPKHVLPQNTKNFTVYVVAHKKQLPENISVSSSSTKRCPHNLQHLLHFFLFCWNITFFLAEYKW